jgi:SAM-dependent methyltransferase
MKHKSETTKVYESFPDYFDNKFEEYKEIYAQPQLKKAISLFPKNAKILDLGCGPGNHAEFFKQKGFDVLCADISKNFLEMCRKKGLKTIEMDFENITLPNNSFDVVWAYASLLHAPKKNLPAILNKIKDILKSKGLLFISMKEGKGEGFVQFKKGGKRWFSLYTKEELEELLKKEFSLIDNWTIRFNEEKSFIAYLYKKLPS